MSRASRARRIAVVAAYGGGGLGLLTAGAFGLLRTEARMARRAIGQPTGTPPVAAGTYGRHQQGEPIVLALLGDSSACGLGVDQPHQTPGAMLAAGLTEAAERPVRLVSAAAVGAKSSDLAGQIEAVLEDRPEVVVVMVGANDVTHSVRPSTAVRHLDQAVRRLHEEGAAVVVGTCPDLGTLEPLAQPLRTIARHWSRQLAAAQTIVVVEAGGRTVSLGDILGPEFAASPSEMFGPDRFHPSAAGYASAVAVLLPSLCAAAGVWAGVEPPDETLDVARGEGVRPIAMAAVEAADEAGTEVAAAQVAGRDRGPRGRWALLRHRIGRTGADVAASAEEEAGEVDRADAAVEATSDDAG